MQIDFLKFSPTFTKRNYLIKKSGINKTSNRKSLLSDFSVDNYKKEFVRVNEINNHKCSNNFN